MTYDDLITALRKHWRLKDLPWEPAALEGCRAVANFCADATERIYVSARDAEGGAQLVCVIYNGGMELKHSETHPDPDTSIARLCTIAAWALSTAEEPPCNDQTLADAIGQRRLADERRALLSKPDLAPEDEARLAEIREELERRWGIWETEEDRRNADLINKIAAHLLETEETP